MYEGTYLNLKWQRIVNVKDKMFLKFSEDGTKLIMFAKNNQTLVLFDSKNGFVQASTYNPNSTVILNPRLNPTQFPNIETINYYQRTEIYL